MSDTIDLTPDQWRERVPQGAPPNFVAHRHAFEFVHAAPREKVWAWLNDPGTFTRQVWPYRVEFVDGGFEEGVLNVHHGPFLNVSGMMTEVDHGEDGHGKRRELRYFYGSNVISMRFIRPTALIFEVQDAEVDEKPATRISGQLDSLVVPWARGPWSLIQKTFWPSFRYWIRREVK